nr:hypothetical protein [Stappia indica]
MFVQLAQTRFIGFRERAGAGPHHPVDQLTHLHLDALQLAGNGTGHFLAAGKTVVPLIAEHLVDRVEEMRARLERGQQRLELALDDLLAHRLAAVRAIARIAQIIGVMLRAALRPAGGHRLVARGAADEAAQREVLVEILAHGSLRGALEPLLHPLPGGKAHQGLVLGRNEGHAPFGHLDISGIEHAVEQLGDALEVHLAAMVARIGGLAFQEALHLGNALQPAAGEGLQGLLDDAGKRLVAHQELAVSGNLLVAIAVGRREAPVAGHHPGLHLLDHLAAVLLALQLALGGEDGLDELALGRVLKTEVQALDAGAAHAERFSELDVELGVAGKALQIVEDDDVVLAIGLGIEIAEQRHHAGPPHEVAGTGDVIGEHRLDLIAHMKRMGPAPCLLRIEAVEFGGLLAARDAAIDQRLGGCGLGGLGCVCRHVSHFLPPVLPLVVRKEPVRSFLSVSVVVVVPDEPITGRESIASLALDLAPGLASSLVPGPSPKSGSTGTEACSAGPDREPLTCWTGSRPKARSTKLWAIVHNTRSISSFFSSGRSRWSTWRR